jgi:hypothetical protein
MSEKAVFRLHSREAYIIIKTIHLMNFAIADTLAPTMKGESVGSVDSGSTYPGS